MTDKVEIAENPNTPVELLTKLATDKSEDVRFAVAENPNTPVESLIKLATDKAGGSRLLFGYGYSLCSLFSRS